MERANHTPGPWIEDANIAFTEYQTTEGLKLGRWAGSIRQGERGAVMIRVAARDAGGVAEVRANMRLVAAAPDMLAALHLHEAYEGLPEDRGGSQGPKGRAHAAWIAARDAAIAKAEVPA